MIELPAYKNKNHEWNGPSFRSGLKCIECGKPAGTKWSKFWCVECNIRRMDRIEQAFEGLRKSYGI